MHYILPEMYKELQKPKWNLYLQNHFLYIKLGLTIDDKICKITENVNIETEDVIERNIRNSVVSKIIGILNVAKN